MRPLARPLLCAIVLAGAVAGPSAAAPDARPRVDRNDIVAAAFPCATLHVAPPLRFLARHPFAIGDVATGERIVFGETRGRRIVRLWIAQFEAIVPRSGQTYRYGFADAVDIGGIPFKPSAFAFSHRAAAAANPADEAVATAAVLRHLGYAIDDALMGARFAAVPDPARRHELIVFYFETIASAGASLTDLYTGDTPQPRWATLAPGLLDRGRASFSLSACPR